MNPYRCAGSPPAVNACELCGVPVKRRIACSKCQRLACWRCTTSGKDGRHGKTWAECDKCREARDESEAT